MAIFWSFNSLFDSKRYELPSRYLRIIRLHCFHQICKALYAVLSLTTELENVLNTTSSLMNTLCSCKLAKIALLISQINIISGYEVRTYDSY